MKIYQTTIIIFLALIIFLLPVKSAFAGSIPGNAAVNYSQTDSNGLDSFSSLFYFFDLRERETFIQLTFKDRTDFNGGQVNGAIAHVQIFDVSNNCNENDFFDNYTVNDTHVYNMRDIQTNDGNPSGVVLPDGAYGIVAVNMVIPAGPTPGDPIGNMRIIDNNGYEYRTNAHGSLSRVDTFDPSINPDVFFSFNFNQQGGVTLSDVVGITLYRVSDDEAPFFGEWIAEPVQGIFSPFDIDIVDNNETIFSCRDIIYSCVNQEHPLLEELLTIAETANVASFEYGINNAIPHSKGGELLCPGNVISEGAVILRPETYPTSEAFMNVLPEERPPSFYGFVGLNNGNGRGSMDSFWFYNFFLGFED